jgi:hypothetical protein
MPDMVHTTALHFYSTVSVHQPNDMKILGQEVALVSKTCPFLVKLRVRLPEILGDILPVNDLRTAS